MTTTPAKTPAIVPATVETHHTFRATDGTKIFYRAWLPPRPTTKCVVLLHRGHEHSGRMTETVARLGLDDAAVFAWDQRGHGQSDGPRGDADSVAQLADDFDAFVRHLADAHGIAAEDTILIAHSVGAVVAATWVHDYAPPIRGMVLLAPALRVKLYVPLAVPALRLKQAVRGGGGGQVKSYVRSSVLTHDVEQRRLYDGDEQIFRQISVNLLLDLHDTSRRLIADAGAITTPTLVLAAGSDWVVRVDAQQAFYEKLSSPRKQFEVFPGMYHAMLHESDRQRVVDRARTFIDECFEARRRDNRALLDADRGGYTRTEFDRLRVPANCAKWKAVRLGMKTVGRLSEGIRLGFSSGFDSGLTLDYVYANRPRGRTPLGRLIDRSYLNSIGWRGIRQRRANLEALLRRTMHDLDRAGRRVHILDIAAGPGRYVLETLAATPDVPATATLRDYKPANIDAAKQLVVELGLLDRVRVQQGDAFDRASLAATNSKPTIGIVSGLYELFPDNAPLRESLAGLADAIETGGYLIYTCQPWHPQLEFIARALPNREGQPWIMRRRTQAEMDALVRAAGFEKVEQKIDRWGIFTVSLAKRI